MIKVWTNGCFDILHRGHIEMFRYAKSLGDELVVGIDTDEKVKLDKGENRPINNLQDRMYMLQSIKYINKVIPFDSTEDLRKTIRWYQPDLMVIGSDWKGKDVIGREFSDKLVFFNRVGDYSTTNFLK
jgi:D-beta-D-heptose 7-phosphate kinase/D-beta-D-heptose 1-phosphate adenosyltransferase|tara:strand:- start:109 stop:492 length:384 start_codon:yes stop_codon:yes gene_type:complete